MKVLRIFIAVLIGGFAGYGFGTVGVKAYDRISFRLNQIDYVQKMVESNNIGLKILYQIELLKKAEREGLKKNDKNVFYK